jgi:serine/threonine-protein kinase HipA
MTSKGPYTEAYVWIWLPGQTEPVVAGKLTAHGDRLLFNYGRSYLARDDAIAIYHPELPLQPGIIEPRVGHRMHGCIRDASPDAWGRRVILNATLGRRGAAVDSDQLDELTYLMESGSDRIGALDFQASPTEYIPRAAGNATLEELMASAERVEKGLPLSPELDQALRHGTSIGGARPKAQVQDRDKRYVAKFAS